jgi:hypothetical protein
MALAIGALPFAPNILIDPPISSLFYLSFYSMVGVDSIFTLIFVINFANVKMALKNGKNRTV